MLTVKQAKQIKKLESRLIKIQQEFERQNNPNIISGALQSKDKLDIESVTSLLARIQKQCM